MSNSFLIERPEVLLNETYKDTTMQKKYEREKRNREQGTSYTFE